MINIPVIKAMVKYAINLSKYDSSFPNANILLNFWLQNPWPKKSEKLNSPSHEKNLPLKMYDEQLIPDAEIKTPIASAKTRYQSTFVPSWSKT